MRIRQFHVVAVQRRRENVQKKRDARVKTVTVLLIKLAAFFPFSVPSSLSLLLFKLPTVGI